MRQPTLMQWSRDVLMAPRTSKAWFQDDCSCSVLDADGDGCYSTYPAGDAVPLCDHCKAHALASMPTPDGVPTNPDADDGSETHAEGEP